MSSDTGVTSDFILDLAGQRLARREGAVWRDYIFLGGQMLAYFDDGADEPIQVVSDHIGMPMLAIDSSGEVVWDALAEPYGELSGSASQPFDPGLRYPGQWQDDLDLEATCDGDNCIFPGPLDGSVSLFENGYRWYRPAWGRYTQADPIEVFDRTSRYSYVRSNPLIFTDELGLFPVLPVVPTGGMNRFYSGANPCEGYSRFFGTRCCAHGSWKRDGYPEKALSMCNSFMNMHQSLSAACVAYCLVDGEGRSQGIQDCDLRNAMRFEDHVKCYYACGFHPNPATGFPPDALEVGLFDVLPGWICARFPWLCLDF